MSWKTNQKNLDTIAQNVDIMNQIGDNTFINTGSDNKNIHVKVKHLLWNHHGTYISMTTRVVIPVSLPEGFIHNIQQKPKSLLTAAMWLRNAPSSTTPNNYTQKQKDCLNNIWAKFLTKHK